MILIKCRNFIIPLFILSTVSVHAEMTDPKYAIAKTFSNVVSVPIRFRMETEFEKCTTLTENSQKTAEKACNNSKLTEADRNYYIKRSKAISEKLQQNSQRYLLRLEELKKVQERSSVDERNEHALVIIKDYHTDCKKNIKNYLDLLKNVQTSVRSWTSASVQRTSTSATSSWSQTSSNPQNRKVTIGSQR